jgi:hypothetical protein
MRKGLQKLPIKSLQGFLHPLGLFNSKILDALRGGRKSLIFLKGGKNEK